MWVVFVVDLVFLGWVVSVCVCVLVLFVFGFLKKSKLVDAGLSQLCALVMLKAKVLAASARM